MSGLLGLSVLLPCPVDLSLLYSSVRAYSSWGNEPFSGTPGELDTVLDLRKDDPLDVENSVYCSDDATPPGSVGSRVAALLDAGTYFLIVDAYTAEQGKQPATTLTYLVGFDHSSSLSYADAVPAQSAPPR